MAEGYEIRLGLVSGENAVESIVRALEDALSVWFEPTGDRRYIGEDELNLAAIRLELAAGDPADNVHHLLCPYSLRVTLRVPAQVEEALDPPGTRESGQSGGRIIRTPSIR
ncbi:hypothetical protein [Micromonospora deserti]|uniref:hypothetical protein n=1 Tax=Micromonospora deserti TaxID=2070366 RepID=UPI0011B38D1D|nr:hypothetical protein [Micromonospora deserti]